MPVFSTEGVSGLLVYILDNGGTVHLQFESKIYVQVLLRDNLKKNDQGELEGFVSPKSKLTDKGTDCLVSNDEVGQTLFTNYNNCEENSQACVTRKSYDVDSSSLQESKESEMVNEVEDESEPNQVSEGPVETESVESVPDHEQIATNDVAACIDNRVEDKVNEKSEGLNSKLIQLSTHNIKKQKKPVKKSEILKKSLKARKININKTKTDCIVDSSSTCDDVTQNKSSSNVQCPYCLQWFKTKRDFFNHRKAEECPHKCNICGKEEPFKAHLLVHLKKHEQDNEISENNPNSKKVKTRMKCSLCGLVVSSSDSLKIHSMLHTGEMAYKCCVCQKTFPSLSSREHHASVHSAEFKFHCLLCDKGFPTRADLAKHQLTHNLQCALCDQTFPNTTSRNCHYRTAHPAQILNCPECNKVFPTKEDLERHSKYHRRLKRKVCPECGAVVCNLKDHMLVHEKERGFHKMFACDQCPQTYLRQCSLQRHLLTHTGERPYACSHCSKTFRTNGTLRKHLLIHTQEKPHQCEQCGKRFSLRSNMMIHKRVHQNFPSKYKCQECFQMFNHNSTLNNHIRTKHSKPTKSRRPKVSNKVATLTATTLVEENVISSSGNDFPLKLNYSEPRHLSHKSSFSLPEFLAPKTSQPFASISSSSSSLYNIDSSLVMTKSAHTSLPLVDSLPPRKAFPSHQSELDLTRTSLTASFSPYPSPQELTRKAAESPSSQFAYFNQQLRPPVYNTDPRSSTDNPHGHYGSSIINVPSTLNLFGNQDHLFTSSHNTTQELKGNLSCVDVQKDHHPFPSSQSESMK